MMFASMYRDPGLNLEHWKKGKTLDKDFLKNILYMYMSICTGRLEEAKDPLELEKQNVTRPCRDPHGILTWVARQWRKAHVQKEWWGHNNCHCNLDLMSVYHGQHRDRASWSLETEIWSQALTNWEHKAAAAASFYTHQHSNMNQGRRLCQFWDGCTWNQLPMVLKLWSLSWLCPSK